MKRSIFSLLLLVLIFSACTIKYVPVQTDGVTIADDFGVNRTKAYTFAAANEYWNKEPQELTNYFTTFYVSIQNRTRDELQVEVNDFGLIDQNGNQFDVITHDYIEKLLAPRQIDYLLINENKEELLDTEEFFNEQKAVMEEWRTAQNNLITYSFHFGNIMPGAKKSGYIFFPKLESEN
jgi:phage anti-repressor protein